MKAHVFDFCCFYYTACSRSYCAHLYTLLEIKAFKADVGLLRFDVTRIKEMMFRMVKNRLYCTASSRTCHNRKLLL